MIPRLALAFLLPLAACAANPTPTPPPEISPEASGETDHGAGLAATKTIETSTEGLPVTLTARLVREDDFKIPFATYAPEGVDYRRLGEGSAVFTSGPARLEVSVVRDPAQSLDLEAYVRGQISGEGQIRSYESRDAWATTAFSFFSGDEMGSIRIGRRGENVVSVLESLPPEMGDGWATTSDVILSEWVWLDNGTGL